MKSEEYLEIKLLTNLRPEERSKGIYNFDKHCGITLFSQTLTLLNITYSLIQPPYKDRTIFAIFNWQFVLTQKIWKEKRHFQFPHKPYYNRSGKDRTFHLNHYCKMALFLKLGPFSACKIFSSFLQVFVSLITYFTLLIQFKAGG